MSRSEPLFNKGGYRTLSEAHERPKPSHRCQSATEGRVKFIYTLSQQFFCLNQPVVQTLYPRLTIQHIHTRTAIARVWDPCFCLSKVLGIITYDATLISQYFMRSEYLIASISKTTNTEEQELRRIAQEGPKGAMSSFLKLGFQLLINRKLTRVIGNCGNESDPLTYLQGSKLCNNALYAF